MGVNVFLDGGDEVGHGMKDAPPQRFVGQFPEPAFDEVEPRRRCRGEVEVEPGVFVQPLADVVVLVGGELSRIRWICRSAGTWRSMVLRNFNHS